VNYIGDTISAYANVTNILAGDTVIAATAAITVAGRYEVKASCGETGSGLTGADNYNLKLGKLTTVAGVPTFVQAGVLDIIQSSAATNANEQGPWYMTLLVGDVIQVRSVAAAGAATAVYNARINATLVTSG